MEDTLTAHVHPFSNQFELMEQILKLVRKQTLEKFSQGKVDLTYEQWIVMRGIQQKNGGSQKEIAQFVRKDPASFTRILDALENKGYIQRSVVAGNRRKYAIKLTQKGSRLLKKVLPLVSTIYQKGFKGQNPAQVEAFSSQLNILFTQLTHP
ncbi:MAG: MarR family transcriptional regulator [Bacteroidota bacterium]